ncbi:MAG TPA: hypothetical protein VMG59_07640 [Phycisphaerae bacterium]|nr:hypothetical protein [Phycisphaerae bacterium]
MTRSFDKIVVDIVKLRDYCLSDTHPRGRHKARVFRSRLGLRAGDAKFLRKALFDAARANQDQLQPTASDRFGRRYLLDFSMTTATGAATIRSSWIVLTGQNVLRLTSCYVK